ncbi:hypothetical protein [Streptomyces sp. NPDC002845]
MNLIELAQTTYTEYIGSAQDELDARYQENRESFLTSARKTATNRFGEAAEQLDWTYTSPDDLPDDIEEATAPLAPGRLEYLRYRYTTDDEIATFELVQPCSACGHDRINEVPGLTKLGELLHQEDDQHQAPDGDAAPGPLTAFDGWESRTARVAHAVRRLMAEHPGAGLTVTYLSCFGHEGGGGSAEVNFSTAGVAELRQVATALGAEVTTSISSTPAPYSYVIEHALARGTTAAGIAVELRGYTKLPDEEAAAWRAEQNQSAEAAEGGEPQ